MIRTTAFFLALAMLVATAPASADGLLHVRQTVFGMDCAPCAYGIEQGLEKLPGVAAVTVSLNEGYAEMDVAPTSDISLRTIRHVVIDNGFTPKDAAVQVEGTLDLSAAPRLQTGAAAYALRLPEQHGFASGEQVRVSGVIGEDASVLRVQSIRAAPAD